MLERLEKKARSDSERADRITRWRLHGSSTLLLNYILWRNRFPIITKIASRLLIISEIYLLSWYFGAHISGELSLIYFLFIILRKAFRGVSQYWRIQFFTFQTLKEKAKAHECTRILTLWSIWYGIVISSGISALAFFLSNESFIFTFALMWIPLFPLELYASNQWALLYTKRRMKRSLILILFARALPILFLIALRDQFQIYSYIIGLFVGKSLESIYLTIVANNELKKDKLLLKETEQYPRNKKEKVNWGALIQYITANGSYPLYQLTTAYILFLADTRIWLTYFVIYHLANMCGFPGARASQSIVMDVFLSLTKSNVEYAKRVTQGAMQAVALYLSLFSGLVICAALSGLLPFLFYSPQTRDIWGIIILLTICQTWYQSVFVIEQATGAEKHRASTLGLVFIALTLAQYILLIHYRGNLQLFYLLECCVLTILSLWLQKRLLFEASPIYTIPIQHEFYSHHKVPAFAWIQMEHALANISRYTKSDHRTILLRLDKRYQKQSTKEALQQEIIAQDKSVQFFCDITQDVSIVHCRESEVRSERVIPEFVLSFAGHIRAWQPLPSLEAFSETYRALFNYKHGDRGISQATSKAFHNLSGKLSSKSEALLESLSFPVDQETREDAHQILSRFKKSDLWSKLPIIINDKKQHTAQQCSTEHYRRSMSYFSKQFLVRNFLLHYQAPFLFIPLRGIPYFVIDMEGISSEEREDLFALMTQISLKATVAKKNISSSSPPLPQIYFDWIADKLSESVHPLGEKISISKKINADDITLSSSHLADGYYFLKFRS